MLTLKKKKKFGTTFWKVILPFNYFRSFCLSSDSSLVAYNDRATWKRSYMPVSVCPYEKLYDMWETVHYLSCLCIILSVSSLPICKHLFIRILCTTNPLKDIAFRYICLQRAASLFLSFCLSLSIVLMLSLHMCSWRTKLLISHSHCSKPPAHRDVKLFVCISASISVFKFPSWLQLGWVWTKILQRSLKSGSAPLFSLGGC